MGLYPEAFRWAQVAWFQAAGVYHDFLQDYRGINHPKLQGMFPGRHVVDGRGQVDVV